jgi:hypothetical protein
MLRESRGLERVRLHGGDADVRQFVERDGRLPRMSPAGVRRKGPREERPLLAHVARAAKVWDRTR